MSDQEIRQKAVDRCHAARVAYKEWLAMANRYAAKMIADFGIAEVNGDLSAAYGSGLKKEWRVAAKAYKKEHRKAKAVASAISQNLRFIDDEDRVRESYPESHNMFYERVCSIISLCGKDLTHPSILAMNYWADEELIRQGELKKLPLADRQAERRYFENTSGAVVE